MKQTNRTVDGHALEDHALSADPIATLDPTNTAGFTPTDGGSVCPVKPRMVWTFLPV
jgi:hypothetical protein